MQKLDYDIYASLYWNWLPRHIDDVSSPSRKVRLEASMNEDALSLSLM